MWATKLSYYNNPFGGYCEHLPNKIAVVIFGYILEEIRLLFTQTSGHTDLKSEK